MSLANLHKVLKCAGNDDVVTMKADDNGDTVTFMFESPSESFCFVAMRWRARCCCVAPLGGARSSHIKHHQCSLILCCRLRLAPVSCPPPLRPPPPPLTPFKKKTRPHPQKTKQKEDDRVSDFEPKLMDIDSEHLGIPDTDYAVTITMPAGEYQRICRDLASIGDTGETF